MKTAAKVLNILSAVTYGILIIVFLVLGFTFLSMNEKAAKDVGIVYLILMIIPLVFLILAITITNKIEKCTCKDSIVVWAIIDIILINFIAGILILCVDEREFSKGKPSSTTNVVTTTPLSLDRAGDNKEVPSNIDVSSRLIELKKLYDSNLITSEEYNSKRENILKDL